MACTVEGGKLARTVNARGLDDLHGQVAFHVLQHEIKYNGSRDAGQKQRCEGVGHAHFGDEPNKAQRGYLCRHHHDEQDERKGQLFEFEVIGMDAVGGER